MAKLEDQKLVKELLDIGLITKDRLIKIQEIAKQTLETDGITKTLLKNLDLDEDKLAEIIAKTFNVPYLQELNGLSCVSVPGLSKSDFVLKFKMIPIIIDNNEITLATINPPYQNILELIQKMTNLHLVPVILSASLYDRLVESIVKDVKLSKAIKIDFESIDVLKRGEKWARESEASGILPPAAKVLEKILETALISNTSDIHFENESSGFLKVRFRLNGVLHSVVTLPSIYVRSIPGVIKQTSSSSTFDNKAFQEGHAVFQVQGQKINVRINTMITSSGEKITLRLLKKNLHVMSLNELGLSIHDFQRLKQMLTIPDAVILFAGPAGCGKTTTMYSALNAINNNSLNISTVENPIECIIDGINQTSVDQIRKNSISETIKALFHHDVDVLAIGEIRSKEEADLLIEAGLTGMVACTTIQSSDAIKALFRLRNLGIKYDELALVLRGIVAQRFVRRICPHCAESYAPDKEILSKVGLLNLPEDTFLSRGKGCKECFGSGYLERFPLFEILLINDQVSSLIYQGCSYSEIRGEAEKFGFTNLRHDGLRKALAGITSLEEVIRVT